MGDAKTPANSINEGLARVYRDTVEVLAEAIAAKDSYTHNHIARIQQICRMVGSQLGLDDNEIEGVCVAALVSDVGKLGVPDHILLKPGPLDPDEFSKMRNHAEIGAELLAKVHYPWNIAEMVRHHHERYDGSGYPDHFEADQIPLGSRIIAVAVVYDALISDRCYREGLPHQEAVQQIESLSGLHFDPAVINAFLQIQPELLSYNKSVERPAETSQAGEHPNGFAAADVISQANDELVSLFEIAQTLSSTLEIDEVAALLAHRTRRLAHAATCVVLLADDNHPNTLGVRAAIGRHQEIIKDATVHLGTGVTGEAAANNKAYIGDFDPTDLALGSFAQTLDLRSCAVAPIVSCGAVLGTINIYDVYPNAFTPDSLRILAFVAQQAALAFENASAFQKVRDSAMRDSLTNLYNTRHLRVFMEREMSRAQRLKEPLSVLGIDLDNFKAINDTFGHSVGDTVLRDVAEIFRKQLRDYDIATRNGGDEFVIVLVRTPKTEASLIASRIQSEIEKYARTLGSAMLGASIGVASFPDDASDLEALLAKADRAMYADKRTRKQGRSAA